jgi:hypothetical protein
VCPALVTRPRVTFGGDSRRLLPPYMVPSRWQVMSSLPKNANGKIDRRALRELFAAEADPYDPSLPGQSRQFGAAEMNPAGDESVKRVDGLMKNVLATTPDNADQDLIESGLLDSMALIELFYAIEEEFTVELLSKISMLSS